MTFARLKFKIRITESFKQTTQPHKMFSGCIAEHNNIIKIHKTHFKIQTFESQIHHSLKRTSSITKTKRYTTIAVGSRPHNERGFVSIFSGHRYLMVSRAKIKSAIQTCTAESIHTGIYTWKRVSVFPCSQVETSIIDTET